MIQFSSHGNDDDASIRFDGNNDIEVFARDIASAKPAMVVLSACLTLPLAKAIWEASPADAKPTIVGWGKPVGTVVAEVFSTNFYQMVGKAAVGPSLNDLAKAVEYHNEAEVQKTSVAADQATIDAACVDPMPCGMPAVPVNCTHRARAGRSAPQWLFAALRPLVALAAAAPCTGTPLNPRPKILRSCHGSAG